MQLRDARCPTLIRRGKVGDRVGLRHAYHSVMDVLDEAGPALESVNEQLSHSDDPARVRSYYIVADPYSDRRRVVVAQWELPDPETGEETWPTDTIRRYSRLLWDRFRDIPDVWPLSMFSTAEDLAEPDQRTGKMVPETA